MRCRTALRLPACLLALLTATPLLAQTATLRGLVIEAETQRPLPGATVVLLTDSVRVAATVSDGDGLFVLPRLPAQRYDLRLTYVGFAALEDTLTLGPGVVVERRFALTAAVGDLDELVVEAEGASGIVAVTAGVQRVRPADIERVPVPGVSGDLAAYVQTVPGVAAVGDRGGQLFVQGGLPSQNLVLLDGLQINRPFHIVGFYSAFPSDIVDTATFAAGGFGAQYGGRLSSVLDIASRDGSKERFAGSVALAPFLSG
ncbi:MAG: TonB-dependent receptor, partial [Bacteroidota bacterium]